MAQYDPQRSRTRRRKADDEGPAPVDALLGPATDEPAAPGAPAGGADEVIELAEVELIEVEVVEVDPETGEAEVIELDLVALEAEELEPVPTAFEVPPAAAPIISERDIDPGRETWEDPAVAGAPSGGLRPAVLVAVVVAAAALVLAWARRRRRAGRRRSADAAD